MWGWGGGFAKETRNVRLGRVSLFVKVTLEQRLEGGEGVGIADICGRALQVRQIAPR